MSLATHLDQMERDEQAEIADKICECLQRQRVSQFSAFNPMTELSYETDSVITNVTHVRPERYKQVASPAPSCALYDMVTSLAQYVA